MLKVVGNESVQDEDRTKEPITEGKVSKPGTSRHDPRGASSTGSTA